MSETPGIRVYNHPLKRMPREKTFSEVRTDTVYLFPVARRYRNGGHAIVGWLEAESFIIARLRLRWAYQRHQLVELVIPAA